MMGFCLRRSDDEYSLEEWEKGGFFLALFPGKWVARRWRVLGGLGVDDDDNDDIVARVWSCLDMRISGTASDTDLNERMTLQMRRGRTVDDI